MWLSSNHNPYKPQFPRRAPFHIYFLAVSCLWPWDCTGISFLHQKWGLLRKSLRHGVRGCRNPSSRWGMTHTWWVLSEAESSGMLASLMQVWEPNSSLPTHSATGFRNMFSCGLGPTEGGILLDWAVTLDHFLPGLNFSDLSFFNPWRKSQWAKEQLFSPTTFIIDMSVFAELGVRKRQECV